MNSLSLKIELIEIALKQSENKLSVGVASTNEVFEKETNHYNTRSRHRYAIYASAFLLPVSPDLSAVPSVALPPAR